MVRLESQKKHRSVLCDLSRMSRERQTDATCRRFEQQCY